MWIHNPFDLFHQTQLGSTKCNVIAAARAALGDRIGQFVPGHPIAGGERTGPDAAFATLYRDRQVLLTPLAAPFPAPEMWLHVQGRGRESVLAEVVGA